MKILFTVPLALALACGAFAQGAKEEMKQAGSDTKDAAKHAGKSVKKGTKKAAHKSADAVGDAADKVKGKTK